MPRVTDRDHTPTGGRRRLLAVFEELDEFQRAYHRQIANGGMFVASRESFAVGERLEVELRLVFRDQSVLVPAEVVSFVPLRFVPPGGKPGVSVQFQMPAAMLRARLEPIASIVASGRPVLERGVERVEPPRGQERRDSERVEAHVPARLESASGRMGARTRDLSESGALLSVDSTPVPIGQKVRLTIAHPTFGEQRSLVGTVVRHVLEEGDVPALAVHFDPSERDAEALAFIESLKRAEQERQLGSIAGPVELLGLATILQMFSSSSDGGTLRIRHGAQEGTVVFEAGAFVHASFGRASGLKALVRMLMLPQGLFEFRAEIDRRIPIENPLPMYSAVLQAVQQVDECHRHAAGWLRPRTKLALEAAAQEEGGAPLEKLEQAIVELARPGTRVQDVLDALPEFDAEITTVLLSLHERGILRAEE